MTSILAHLESISKGTPADKVITIPAQDTLEDWFYDYIDEVEDASGLEFLGDDSQYGKFRAPDDTIYRAYVDPSRSDDETWTVTLDLDDTE